MEENNVLIVKVNHEEKTVRLRVANQSNIEPENNSKITIYTIPVNIRNIVTPIVNIISQYPEYYLVKEGKDNGKESIKRSDK